MDMSTSNISREELLKLTDERNRIDKEIQAMSDILVANGNVGLRGPLVDREGFPRNDIDIVQVRTARNKIICLQNDRKAIMNQIENGLHAIHSSSRRTSDQSETPMDVDGPTDQHKEPFLKVTRVDSGSPAEQAGIILGDEIVQFGSVNADNYKDLREIGNVVQNSVNQPITIKVMRQNCRVARLTLVPKRWSGPGFLGCAINTIENPER